MGWRRWWWVGLLAALAGAQESAPEGFRPLVEATDAQWDLTLTVTGDEPLELLFGYGDPTHHYRLKLNGVAAALARVDGEAVELARSGGAFTGGGIHRVLLRRRESALYVIVDGRLLLQAWDGRYAAGPVYITGPAERVALSEGAYQPVEEIYFTDDFMRTKDQQQLGVWRHVAGKWRFYSVLETNEKADVTKSVNPFSLGLDPEPGQVAEVETGHPFWCDYDYSASVRSRGDSWAGLTLGGAGGDRSYLLRVDLRERPLEPRRVELVLRTPDGEKLLNSGTALLSAEEWYRLGFRLRGDRLQCLLDGDVIFDRVDPRLLGGPIGLWSSGDGSETLFDDIRCVTNYDWQLDRPALLRAGAEARGKWELAEAPGRIDGEPGPRRLLSTAAAPATYAFGDPAGSDYRLDASVKLASAGRTALLFGWRDAGNYLRAEWDSRTGKLSLIRRVDGQDKPIGLVTDPLTPGTEHDVSLDLLTPGRVQIRRDGLLRMRVAVDELPAGKWGLATDGAAATFDDLRWRQYVAVDTEVAVDNANFADDPFMLHWASSLADWFPKGEPAQDANGQQIFWHKGDFYRAYTLELPVGNKEAPFDLGEAKKRLADGKGSIALLLNATAESWQPPADEVIRQPLSRLETVAGQIEPGDGYALHIIPVGTTAELKLFRQGVVVKEAKVAEGIDKVTVGHDGGVTWVEVDGRDVMVFHDHQPLTGPRVALRMRSKDELFHVKCRREGIIDEVFERAPADWLKQGQWEITNRFSCTPTWSHMTALERGGLGVLWHKMAFPGDVTVEYYAGMRMQSDYAMYYPRPGDFNATLAAKPLDLASGLSFLPGAWDAGWTGTWTRWTKGLQTIVETDQPLVPRTRENSGTRYIPVPYISEGRDIHGAWYYVKNRYVAGQLEGFFDNVKVLEAPAPKVEGDRVAVWTQDNQIVIARVRITYRDKVVPKRLLEATPVEPRPEGRWPVALTTDEAPGLRFDFENGLDGWRPRDDHRGVKLTAESGEGRNYLLVRNLLPGDRFEAVLPLGEGQRLTSLDLTRTAVLRFDYKIAPDARVNIYLTLNGREFCIPLTRETEDSPVLPILLRPDEIIADGRWHSARLNLGAALRRQFGGQPVQLTAGSFGNRHQGYLLAGFGGNQRGAWYALDQVSFVPVAPAGATLTPKLQFLGPAGDGPELKAVHVALDTKPQGTPTEPATGPLTLPADGEVAYLHARAELADGGFTPVAHLPVLLAAGGPPLRLIAADQPWDGLQVRVAYGDRAPVAVEAAVREYAVKPAEEIRYDAERAELVLDLSAAPLTYADGEVVPLKIVAKSADGQLTELVGERRFSLSADRTPPLPPRIGGLGPSADMEDGRLPLTPATPAATAVELSDDSPEPGGRSARIVNLTVGGSLNVFLTAETIDVGRHPLLLFDYKMPPPVRSDLTALLPGLYYAIFFTDASTIYTPLAFIAEPVRDDQWHRAQLNLQQALARKSPFTPRMYGLARLSAADLVYSGAAPGASWWLDNLRFVKVVSGAGGVRVAWRATDPSGIAAYRIGLLDDERAEPTREVSGSENSALFQPEGAGLRWFAVQARDNAGNWSRVARCPVLVDGEAPGFQTPSPAPGPLGVSEVTLKLTGLGEADLDPASLKFAAGAVTVPVVPGSVQYNPDKASLTWEWAWATKQFSGRVADGTPLKLTVTGADLAGTPLPPASWDYTIRYAADKQPPAAPEVEVAGQQVAATETFAKDLGALVSRPYGHHSPRVRLVEPERGDQACRVTSTGYGVPLNEGRIDLLKTPYLSFDYKLPSDAVKLNLLLAVNGTAVSIRLNGRNRTYDSVATAKIEPDGQWRTLVLNLRELLQSRFKNTDQLDCRYIMLNEYGSSDGPHYWLDNILVSGAVKRGEVAASWVGYDATGIQAAAATFGPDLGAKAPTEGRADLTKTSFTAEKPGVYLLQVRCQDGAGNWGGPARRIVVVE